MILLIDNYDSFSYNLYQLIGTIEPDIKVIRNDKLTIEELESIENLDGIIISPGPGRPQDGGVSLDIVRHFAGKLPILGICLGHQAICEAFGGRVSYAKELMHGKKKTIYTVGESKLFEGLGDSFQAARYHSLAAVKETIPETLKVTAKTKDGEVMAVMHREYPIYGVQFHPESILTPDGKIILSNFLMQASKVSNYHANI